MMYRSHPKPNNWVGTWGFQGQNDHSQDKKNKCLISSFWTCNKDGTTQIICISGNNSFLGKIPSLNYFSSLMEGQQFSLEPEGSQWSLA